MPKQHYMIWIHIKNSEVRRIQSPDLDGAKRGNRTAWIDTATSVTTPQTPATRI
jgi:hypothetical protein